MTLKMKILVAVFIGINVFLVLFGTHQTIFAQEGQWCYEWTNINVGVDQREVECSPTKDACTEDFDNKDFVDGIHNPTPCTFSSESSGNSGGSTVPETYIPISPLPIGEGGESTVDFDSPQQYVTSLFVIFLSVILILAVIRLVVCGLQYMLSESISDKGSAKKCIWTVIGGIALVLLSVLVLTIINPELTQLRFFETFKEKLGPEDSVAARIQAEVERCENIEKGTACLIDAEYGIVGCDKGTGTIICEGNAFATEHASRCGEGCDQDAFIEACESDENGDGEPDGVVLIDPDNGDLVCGVDSSNGFPVYRGSVSP